MATKSPITRIYTDLVKALSGVVESKYIFLGRPNTSMNSDCPMTKFAVVELPVRIRDYAIGQKKWMLVTQGVFFLFTKGKSNNTLNVNAASDFVDEVTSLFPIVGDVCSATNPVVLLDGSDEYGYQVTSISFDLITKVNVFSNDNN